MGSRLIDLRERLNSYVTLTEQEAKRFFKTGRGEYAEKDVFIGIRVPDLRKIARQYDDLTLEDLRELISSSINEERLLALLILIRCYEQTDDTHRTILYNFYVNHLSCVNNWNLVDASAPSLIGAYLWDKDRSFLLQLATSKGLWDRRISIVSTLFFIKKDDLDWTYKIAELLLRDPEDLIHKAVGWMLREAGKRDEKRLCHFLETYASIMPRTMVRYSTERLSQSDRERF